MSTRVFLLAACAALLSGTACRAQEDTFERPNEMEECFDTAPVDFLAYAEGLPGTVCGADQCEYTEKSSSLFDIKYRMDYKVIEYQSSPELESEDGSGEDIERVTYILYQCGNDEPADMFIQDKIAANESTLHFIEIPLTAVATDQSTVGWMLEELEVLDRVRFAGSFNTAPCMQKIAAPVEEDGCGRLLGTSFDEVPTNSTDFDVDFSFQSDVDAKQVFLQASADPSPLARAEHIVYLAAFFNVEARAIQYYTDVANAYTDQSNAVPDAAMPTVAWVSLGDIFGTFMNAAGEDVMGQAFTVSFARYKALLTRDAGGALLDQGAVLNTTGAFANNDDIVLAEAEYASAAEWQASIQEVLSGVDLLIDESFVVTTADDFLGALGLNGTDVSPTMFPFIASENVWRHDKDKSVGGNDDWFGEAVGRPDTVHKDLQEIITPGSLPNHTLKFFRNFSKGENSTEVGPDACTTMTCDAFENQMPLTVSLSADAPAGAASPEAAEGGEGASVTEGSPAGLKLAAGAVTAAAVLAAMMI